MSEFVIYHNPRCSKSRKALELLHAQGVDPRVVDYLRDPPDAATLRSLLALLENAPLELVRRKEAEAFAASGLTAAANAEQVVQALVQHPRLLERPIVLRGERAVLARPPERVLELF